MVVTSLNAVVLVVALLTAACGRQTVKDAPQVAPGPATKMLIDGSKNPELIPDWAAWEMAFNNLAAVKKYNIVPALEMLALSATDSDMVFKEAEAQKTRLAECAAINEGLAAKMKATNAPFKDILVAQQKAILEYRVKTLDAADRVLRTLSTSGRKSIQAFVAKMRHDMQVEVWPQDFAFYMRPR